MEISINKVSIIIQAAYQRSWRDKRIFKLFVQQHRVGVIIRNKLNGVMAGLFLGEVNKVCKYH